MEEVKKTKLDKAIKVLKIVMISIICVIICVMICSCGTSIKNEEIDKYHNEILTVEIIGSLNDMGYIVSECNGNLRKLILPESLKHIGKRAFEDMEWNFYIEFPEGLTDVNIKEDAFIYASHIIFLCRENSVAHQYAKKHNIEFEIIE